MVIGISKKDIVYYLGKDGIEGLAHLRDIHRKYRNWEASDQIRDALLSLGIKLEDKESSTVWRWVRGGTLAIIIEEEKVGRST